MATNYMSTARVARQQRPAAARPASTGGCGSCGGSHPTPPRPEVYDPCAGGIPPAKRSTETCTGCGGNCGGACGTAMARTRTYDSEACPTFAVSCETKLAVRDCAKEALCDFARCVTDVLCPDGRYDPKRIATIDNRNTLADCVGQLVCSFLRCLPDALCPPPCEPELPAPEDCLPCDYAVEVRR